MDSIQCAVALAKLERFHWEIERRIENGRRYDELLEPLASRVVPIRVRPDRNSVYGQYTIRVRGGRGRMQDELKAKGIPTAVHYPLSLHQQPAYASGYAGQSFPASERLAREVVSLPMHAELTEAVQRRIVDAVEGAVREPA
jgi:UDP-2-acetamido-2-deoxy-ribo-hexuluronate aminotransferase